jgi:predicted O-linked N-acetylglucosamine transferase (SPINDLY family)
LAGDPARLLSIRQKLAANRLTTPLFDTDRFRRHIERAYEKMVETSRRGMHAEAFSVEPVV